MEKIFYLQTELKKITSDFIFSAFEGILKNNYQYKFFEDIDDVPLNKNVVVIGYVEDTIKWFEKMDIDEPKPFDIPDFLLPFAKREIDFKTRKSFIDGNYHLPIFIKPHSRFKAFSSGIATSKFTIDFELNNIPDDFMIMTSEIIDIQTEYRCFVTNNELVGIKHYKGDFKIFPNKNHFDEIYEMIKLCEGKCASYSLDIGLNNDILYLIEMQDAWSIGNYGLDGKTYIKFLLNRWNEIIK